MYETIKSNLITILKDNYFKGIAIKEIISTQAVGLKGISDAIIEFQKMYPDYPKIIFKQYLTDIPSKGCVHYFHGLKTISTPENSHIQIHTLASERLPKKVKKNLKIIDIEPLSNPMVRKGFKDFNRKCMNEPIELEKYMINPEYSIAVLMLGSAGSHACIEYAKFLAEQNDYQKIFVFTSGNQKIIDGINELRNESIVALGPQNDFHTANFMARSNLTIIRGGGLTIMEQLAILGALDEESLAKKKILIHHQLLSEKGQFSTGIEWEDGNIDFLIDSMKEKAILIQKTSPKTFAKEYEACKPYGVEAEQDLQTNISYKL